MNREDFVGEPGIAINRDIERQELKKHCIEFFTGQRFESFVALRTNTQSGYPEFSFDEAAKEGRIIQFFEQAFIFHLPSAQAKGSPPRTEPLPSSPQPHPPCPA